MLEKRRDPRMMCAELVDITWRDEAGRAHRDIANLEDISQSGICVQLDHDIPIGTRVAVRYGKGKFAGAVRYSAYRDIGHYIGVEFEAGTKWNARQFQPQHLLDPRELVMLAIERDRARRKVSATLLQ
jgi:hypothetical protein